MRLEFNTHPAVAFVGAFVIPRRDGIGEREKGGGIAAASGEAFDVQILLVVEHVLESLTADVARSFAVDGITDLHVVGGNAFCDGASRTTDAEKPAGDFLPGADLCECPVATLVEISLEGFISGGDDWGIGHDFGTMR